MFSFHSVKKADSSGLDIFVKDINTIVIPKEERAFNAFIPFENTISDNTKEKWNLPYIHQGRSPGNDILSLLKVWTTDLPNFLFYNEKSDYCDDEVSSWFYEMAKNLYAMVCEHEMDNWVYPYKSPVLYLQNALDTPPLLNIEKLKTTKNLLAFSGGKESTFASHIFDSLNIPYKKIGIFDRYQTQNKPNEVPNTEDIFLDTMRIVPHFKATNVINSINKMDDKYVGVGESLFIQIVPIQRLLVCMYAVINGYDHVFFGDELERHQLYRIDKKLYPTHDFYQTQWFYNLLMRVLPLKIYTPICNFSQVQIMNLIAKENKVITSCWKYNYDWCNECSKCKRIAYFMYHLVGENFNKRPGYENLKYDYKVEQESIYSISGVMQPSSSTLPIFVPIKEHMENNSGMSNNWKDMTPVEFPPLQVWDNESMEKIKSILG